MTDDVQVESVDAGPVKRFFIDILTRDVELNAAILDLVDNSIDSASDLRASGNTDDIKVEIEASSKGFSISDNCAGITVQAARSYVFKLGRPDGVDGLESSIGQFGVGMKRSLFKLGTSFSVDSVTSASHWEMSLDVLDWLSRPTDWTIELNVHEPADGKYPARGTTIIVDKLIPSVAKALDDLVGRNHLKEELRSKHRMALERGIDIVLNGESLKPIPTVLAVSPDEGRTLHPLIERFELQDDAGRPVSVEIYAGVAPDSQTREDDEPEKVDEAERAAGWYVFGNDRLLLGSDTSPLTGWAGQRGNLPLYHNQFSRFRGYVYMQAKDSEALPWNTTKTGVESTDSVWTSVRGEMVKAGRQVIELLNDLKVERTADNQEQDRPITQALASAHSATVAQVSAKQEESLEYPAPNPALTVASKGKRIAYTVEDELFDAVSAAMNVTSAAGVGRGTFDYYFEKIVKVD